MQKGWNLAKQKKVSLYQLFKTRICAFMTYVQFWPKSNSNLRSVVRDSRVRCLPAMTSYIQLRLNNNMGHTHETLINLFMWPM